MPALAVMAVAVALQTLPAHTGDCKWVHGRYIVANGSSVRRIWIIGTHRVVALWDDDDSIPSAVRRYEGLYSESEGLYGDFRICALEKNRPGQMQHVRISTIRRLTYHGRPF